jgi:hypothetical protein
MTEAEWLTELDPEKLYLALRNEKNTFRNGKGWVSVRRFPVSDRKFRLYCCACCERVLDLIPQHEVRALLAVAERWAEGDATEEEVREAMEVARRIRAEITLVQQSYLDMAAAQLSALAVTGIFLTEGLGVAFAASVAKKGWGWRQVRDLVDLLHDVVGNPFRPVAFARPRLVPLVVSLAQAAYDERVPPKCQLDPIRLSILADALEDAGCTDNAILGHLRSPRPHVRGCWAVDLCLGLS